MLVWLTLPFYDFCGFRFVAVNSVYKLQFFTFIFHINVKMSSSLVCLSLLTQLVVLLDVCNDKVSL